MNLLSTVTLIQYPDILIDEHLTRSKHISRVQSLIAIGIIERILLFINTKIAFLLYFSLIYPYLTYYNIAWASTCGSHLDRLNILQKRTIPIVFLLPFLSSNSLTFINNNLLNIHQIHSLQVALFMFSRDYNALPKIFSGFLTDGNNCNDPRHFLSRTHECSPSFSKSTFKLIPIQCCGPRLPSIPSPMKNQLQSCLFNILLFKKSYKLYIFCAIL